MVTTLSPNAKDTPTSPIPTGGKPAAITALPQPANVSQNVPIASAAYFLVSMVLPHFCPTCSDARGGILLQLNAGPERHTMDAAVDDGQTVVQPARDGAVARRC